MCVKNLQLASEEKSIHPLVSEECEIILILGWYAVHHNATVGWYAVLRFLPQMGNTATVRLLLDRGAAVNVAKRNGYTPLHTAAQVGTALNAFGMAAQHTIAYGMKCYGVMWQRMA